MRYFIFSILFVFSFSSLYSQDFDRKHAFTLELGLPNSFVNKAYKDVMQGLVNIAPYYQYTSEGGFIIGTGVRYSYFAVNEFRVPSKVFGGCHSMGAFGKIGYEKFVSDRFSVDMSVKVGYAEHIYSTDILRANGTPYIRLNSNFFEPTIGFVLMSDEANSYRLTAGYAFQGYGFKPWYIGLDSNIGYDPVEFDKISSFLTIGFGYTHYFNGKSSEGFSE